MNQQNSHTKKAQNIFIVENHPVVRRGLAEMLMQHNYQVCGEASNCGDALKGILSQNPDMIILDLSLGEDDGIQLIKQLQEEESDAPILVFSMREDALYVKRALQAGAKGYVTRQEVMEVLIDGVREMLSGKTYVSQSIAGAMAQYLAKKENAEALDPLASLSEREKEVYILVGKGYSFSEIAEKIFLSPKTIESYFARIKLKLNLERNRDLLRHAISNVSKIDKPYPDKPL